MHCGQLLQRNEENRESSEKRVDTGNADGKGIPATRRALSNARHARADATRALSTRTETTKKCLFHAGFLHIENFSPA
jgi:hypothetical protein